MATYRIWTVHPEGYPEPRAAWMTDTVDGERVVWEGTEEEAREAIRERAHWTARGVRYEIRRTGDS
jgi:hypothetical protein